MLTLSTLTRKFDVLDWPSASRTFTWKLKFMPPCCSVGNHWMIPLAGSMFAPSGPCRSVNVSVSFGRSGSMASTLIETDVRSVTVRLPTGSSTGGSFRGWTVSRKSRDALDEPSLTRTVTSAVPNWLVAGCTRIVRTFPVPPRRIPDGVTNVAFDDVAVTVNADAGVSASLTLNDN